MRGPFCLRANLQIYTVNIGQLTLDIGNVLTNYTQAMLELLEGKIKKTTVKVRSVMPGKNQEAYVKERLDFNVKHSVNTMHTGIIA